MSDSGRAWTWRHLIIKSDLPATTRHVLLTLSCFMNDMGGGCYPSQETLAKATGLSDRAVRTHLEVAESAGWVKRSEHGFRGQKWRSTEYEALWPDPLDVDKGEERGSAPSDERCGTSFRKVRNDVPTTSPIPSNSPLPQGQTGTPALDVGGSERINAALQPKLYLQCCAIDGHKPGLTDKLGGWVFPQSVIEQAKKALEDDLLNRRADT